MKTVFDIKGTRLYHPQVMSVQHVVKPYLLTAKGANLELEFSLESMARLKDMLSSSVGILQAQFDFSTDNFASKVRVRADAKLKVLCQRCREEMSVQLPIDSKILLVRTEDELAELPDEIEAMVVEHEMSLASLIEDELILAMPILSRHETDKCSTKAQIVDDKAEGTYKPFANLKDKWSN